MTDKLINIFFTSDFHVFVLTDKVVVKKGMSGIGAHLAQDVVREYRYNSVDDLAGILAQVRRDFNPQPTDRWFLGLPLRYFTLINFSLPAVARENLDQAVRYALIRHIPYDLDQAQVSYQVVESQGTLEISAVIIGKDTLRPFIESASNNDLTLYSVFPSVLYWTSIYGDGTYVSQAHGYGECLVYQNGRIVMQTWAASIEDDSYFPEETSRLLANISELPDKLLLWEHVMSPDDLAERLGVGDADTDTTVLSLDQPHGSKSGSKSMTGYEISLLPDYLRRRKALNTYMVYGSILFFIVTLFVMPVSKLAGQKRHLTKIENRIERISDSAEEINRLRHESSAIMDSIEAMAEMKRGYPSVINILSELTEAVPESAWLYRLDYSNKSVTIQGEADSATAVIEAIENSPGFKEVRFSSPVTKSGARDRFTVVAEVVI